MPTQLFLKQPVSLGAPSYLNLTLNRSVLLAATSSTETVASSVAEIQVTDVTNGNALAWLSAPVAAAVTIAANATGNFWAKESSTAVNTGVGFKVVKVSGGSVVSTILDVAAGAELTASYAAQNFNGAPTSTALAVGDRIGLVPYAKAAGGTMAAGTLSLAYGGSTAAAAGDSYIIFGETLIFQNEPEVRQTAYIQSSGNTHGTLAFTVAIAAGNRIMVGSNDEGAVFTLSTPTDTLANTYAKIGSTQAADTTHNAYLWYTAATSSGGANTVTINTLGVTSQEIYAQEIVGMGALDQQNGTGSSGSNVTSINSGTVSTTSPYEVIFAFGYSDTTGVPTAPYSLIRGDNGNVLMGTAVTTAGNYSANWTQASGTAAIQMGTFPWSIPPLFLTAGTGTVTLAAESASFILGNTLAAGTGTITLTAEPASFVVGNILAAGAGTITLTGESAAFILGNTLAAGAGTLTLSGQPANFVLGNHLTAGTGTITLAGESAAFVLGNHLAAGTGTLTLSGIAATFTGGSPGGNLLTYRRRKVAA